VGRRLAGQFEVGMIEKCLAASPFQPWNSDAVPQSNGAAWFGSVVMSSVSSIRQSMCDGPEPVTPIHFRIKFLARSDMTLPSPITALP
jgi:hypothetical protein